MTRQRSIPVRVSFISRSALIRRKIKVAPTHNKQHASLPNSFQQINPKIISPSPTVLSTNSPNLENSDAQKQSNSIPTFSPKKNHMIDSHSTTTKENNKCHKILLISFGILLMLLALTAVAISIYLLVIVESKTTTTPIAPASMTTNTILTSTTTTTTTTPICTPRIYSANFTGGAYTASLCSSWTSFVASLTCSNYASFTLSGTFDTNGITATNQVTVNAIATALISSSTYTGISNGITWKVSTCSPGIELTTTGAICACNTGYTMRPCIGNPNWGGVNRTTCGAPSQMMTLSFY